jgi:heavy metal sensor kinase
MRRSIRTRLTFWYLVLLVCTLTAFSLGVLWLHAQWSRAQFDSELTSLGAATSRAMQEELSESGNLRKAVRETRTSLDVPERTMAILDVTGRPMAAHWNGFPFEATAAPAEALIEPRLATVTVNGTSWRVLRRPESSAGGDYVILVAGTLDRLAHQQSLLARILLVATLLLALATGGVSWWIASAGLRPVTAMAAQAQTITSQSLDRRLAATMMPNELSSFVHAFNQLLDRLGGAVLLQRQFMADASHELRTPVSVIQTAAEVTLQREVREASEYREALVIVGEQSTRLTRMVEDMLVLARADAGGHSIRRRLVDLDEIVAECVRAVSVIAATRNVQVLTTSRSDVVVNADDGLLRRLVMNLLDNAVEYTPHGGAVRIDVTGDAAVATITVSDTGPGIPQGERERVFQRFVRLDPARATTSGAGLGLPIVRWIAEEHGGTVSIDQNAAGGCLFIVRLPRRESLAPDAGANRWAGVKQNDTRED